jgi:hypothetical protein
MLAFPVTAEDEFYFPFTYRLDPVPQYQNIEADGDEVLTLYAF